MTKAAKSLGMSVANVSRVTKRFEQNTGLQIFNTKVRRGSLSAQSLEIINSFRPLMVDILKLRAALRMLTATQPQDSPARQLQLLEDEIAQLKRQLADEMLDNAVLKEVASKTCEPCRSSEG